MGGVINSVVYADGRKIADVAIDDISEVLKQSGRFVWIGLHEPDESLLRKVQKEFGLHELAIEDALMAHQRPKVDQYGDSVFVVLRTVHYNREADRIEFGETHIFVGPNYVVTVRHGPSLGYADVRARCESAPSRFSKGPAFVLYALMDFIVDHYFPVVEALEDDLDALEDSIFGDAFRRETTGAIYRLKRDLVEVKRGVFPLVDVTNRLIRFDLAVVTDDMRPYFQDVYDHVMRLNEMLDTLRDLLTTALEAQLALITVSQNESMKRLAGWAAIIAVPTMIAGVYGMNFEFMPELKWRWGYPLIMALTVAACGYLYYRFKRAGWL